jgi:hypothetical protein
MNYTAYPPPRLFFSGEPLVNYTGGPGVRTAPPAAAPRLEPLARAVGLRAVVLQHRVQTGKPCARDSARRLTPPPRAFAR